MTLPLLPPCMPPFAHPATLPPFRPARQAWSEAGEGDEAHGAAPPGMPEPMDALQLAAGMEGAGGSQPFWSLAALPRLQVWR